MIIPENAHVHNFTKDLFLELVRDILIFAIFNSVA